MINPVEIYHQQNDWKRQPGNIIKDFIERDVMRDILPWLDDPDILILHGPRQSGKTTLLKHLIDLLRGRGVGVEQIHYFNLDSKELSSLLSSPAEFVQFIKNYSLGMEPVYLLMDEIQRINDAGLFLKEIYDLGLNWKFILTGSSSLDLRSKTKEHLTGRKKEFWLWPLSFQEIVRHEDKIPMEAFSANSFEALNESFTLYDSYLHNLLMQYLLYGGYPKPYLQTLPEKKIAELREIYSSYVKKDIQDYLRIEEPQVFNRLVTLLAHQIGNLVNKKELSNTLGTSWRTIDKYSFLLEETYVLHMLSPFFTNPRKEITKMPKVYFADSGLRNCIANDFNDPELRGDTGQLMENFVCRELTNLNYGSGEFMFWRTQAGAEVDFVVTTGQFFIPIEVKYTKFSSPRIPRSLRNFVKQYPCKKILIINRDLLSKTILEKNIDVYHIPPQWLPFFIRANLLK